MVEHAFNPGRGRSYVRLRQPGLIPSSGTAGSTEKLSERKEKEKGKLGREEGKRGREHLGNIYSSTPMLFCVSIVIEDRGVKTDGHSFCFQRNLCPSIPSGTFSYY